jgi:hypothetical protein
VYTSPTLVNITLESSASNGKDPGTGIPNQYFSAQVVPFSTFRKNNAGNPSKHCEFGRGGGDRTHDLRLLSAAFAHPRLEILHIFRSSESSCAGGSAVDARRCDSVIKFTIG